MDDGKVACTACRAHSEFAGRSGRRRKQTTVVGPSLKDQARCSENYSGLPMTALKEVETIANHVVDLESHVV